VLGVYQRTSRWSEQSPFSVVHFEQISRMPNVSSSRRKRPLLTAAGALGVATWVALRYIRDGRWLLDR
jgi:hypothetical protein